MTALYIILGIILFFLLILSIKVKVTVHSEDGVSLAVGWLFLKFDILPKKEKAKKKKKKKEKKKKKDFITKNCLINMLIFRLKSKNAENL